MARKQATIKNEIVKQMKTLGIYKPEYKNVITIYAGMLSQYEHFEEEFIEKKYPIEEEYTNKAGATNMRKTPLLSCMEKLRMDIATYSNILCLNPKSLENVTAEKANKSKLANILSEMK